MKRTDLRKGMWVAWSGHKFQWDKLKAVKVEVLLATKEEVAARVDADIAGIKKGWAWRDRPGMIRHLRQVLVRFPKEARRGWQDQWVTPHSLRMPWEEYEKAKAINMISKRENAAEAASKKSRALRSRLRKVLGWTANYGEWMMKVPDRDLEQLIEILEGGLP